ncbi:MAG: PIG-L family deacetylase [Planctomycetota bacterium]|nr:PIG-L family deacetylase [Planctomycetota bacterium]MDA0935238.1 PIG-L family deacetylase [Planctomycetota bacterium]
MPHSKDGYQVAGSPLAEFRVAPVPGPVLCFAPHPDDEVIGPGGVLARHVLQGDAVRVVLATDGTAGDPDRRFGTVDELRAHRREESRAGLAELGVIDVVFWGYPDGCVVTADDVEGIARRAAEDLSAFRPRTVYLPWSGEGHSDHRALHAGVCAALDRLDFDGEALGYEVWTAMDPDVVIDTTAAEGRKRNAIRRYATQLAYVDYEHVIFGLNAYRSLAFQAGRGFAEAFERLGGTR